MSVSASESWVVTIPIRGDLRKDVGSPISSIHVTPIIGGGPIGMVTISRLEVNSRRLTKHIWIGKDLDVGERYMLYDGPAGTMAITFSNGSLRPISFLLLVLREPSVEAKPWSW